MLDISKMGENIRRERKRQLLTIEKLAEMSEITDNFLGKIERGDGTPSLQTIVNIANSLGVSIDSLLNKSTQYSTEQQFLSSVMEINNLSAEKKAQFIDFINTNIKYFK